MCFGEQGEKNVALVLHGIDDLRLEEKQIPQPGPGQVQVAIKKVGICMSDVHYWTHGCIGDFVVKHPMVMGHESSGVVSAIGEGVDNLEVGDRVAIEPGVPCRRCSRCKVGRYNLCPKMRFCATPPVDGSLATYFVHDADFCFKLPEHVSLDEAALLEPLSVAVHAVQRARVHTGDRVVICGAGPIGLVSLLVAKAQGAGQVVVTDIDDKRLAKAKELGAFQVVNVMGLDAKGAAKAAVSAFGVDYEKDEKRANAVIECSGTEQGTKTGIYASTSGGTVVLVGMGKPEFTLPILHAEVHEIDIRGVFRYVNAYPVALDMLASGKVDLKPLITHRFSINNAVEAFNTAKSGKDVIKVVIDCDL
mmetsp:Transcript_5992/g.18043  ORF Transcript_5992/g.18043 Transcript_5992/m.18043 type:complete len:362 (-) Transcript_5992:138-1223(-)